MTQLKMRGPCRNATIPSHLIELICDCGKSHLFEVRLDTFQIGLELRDSKKGSIIDQIQITNQSMVPPLKARQVA